MTTVRIAPRTNGVLPLQRLSSCLGAPPRFPGLERQRRGSVDHTPSPTPPRGRSYMDALIVGKVSILEEGRFKLPPAARFGLSKGDSVC